MNSQHLSNYIEKLRYGRHITQENLLDGITSTRQYQRYLNGISDIPLVVVEKLAHRMGLTSHNLLVSYEEKIKIQSLYANQFYNAAALMDEKEIQRLAPLLENEQFIEENKFQLYQCAKWVYDYQKGRLTEPTFLAQLSELINYPAILKNNVLSEIEIQILMLILRFLPAQEKIKVIQKYEELYTGETLLFSGSYELQSYVVYYNLARYYGIEKNYPKVIELCLKAIHQARYLRLNYLFDQFYFYLALAHLRLGHQEEYQYYLAQLYHYLMIAANPLLTKRMVAMVQKDLNLDLESFASTYTEKTRPLQNSLKFD